ncbi:hypothetical protein AVEN_112548-1 [Araneus ventricosus]|uniref:Uncharacterized protein n=1 Tax=Araneus ventricosus TaxID=182803 RepID=A0A4Y2P831_ARAVE|nr:hypothetical protein AVEN_112548-1 [Araneus ventricosus]
MKKCDKILNKEGVEIRLLQRFPYDITPCQDYYKYAAERLWSANAFEESLGISSTVRTGDLSAIESAVIDIINELLSRSGSAVAVIASDLSVCVDNLYKCYCSCYMCYVFTEYSRINRLSPLPCFLDCFPRTHTGYFFNNLVISHLCAGEGDRVKNAHM